jgi:hypothetical protein
MEIDQVLRAAGWTVTGISSELNFGRSPMGFGIMVRNAMTAPPYAIRLQRAFFAIGIPMGGAENHALLEGQVEIVVGRKPNPN